MSEIAARVYRGATVEAVHNATIVVLGADGRLTHSLSEPAMVTMTRSALKPFQLLPAFLSGAVDHYQFSPKQLAIMCGSHCGTDEHREVVLENLAASESSPEHLKCGCHVPIYMQQSGELPIKGEEADPTRHNCSGKHSGFLAQAKFLGDNQSEYLDQKSKTQRAIISFVSDFCDYPLDKMPVGTDGCSAPNYPLPLINIARAFQKIVQQNSDDSRVRTALGRVKEAMMTHPKMVSGDGRFDYDLARSFENNLICKVGAESLEVIAFAEPSLAIAVKVHDGNFRALGAICVETLKQLGLIDNIDAFPYLKAHERPVVKNDRKLVTGEIFADFKLRKV